MDVPNEKIDLLLDIYQEFIDLQLNGSTPQQRHNAHMARQGLRVALEALGLSDELLDLDRGLPIGTEPPPPAMPATEEFFRRLLGRGR